MNQTNVEISIGRLSIVPTVAVTEIRGGWWNLTRSTNVLFRRSIVCWKKTVNSRANEKMQTHIGRNVFRSTSNRRSVRWQTTEKKWFKWNVTYTRTTWFRSTTDGWRWTTRAIWKCRFGCCRPVICASKSEKETWTRHDPTNRGETLKCKWAWRTRPCRRSVSHLAITRDRCTWIQATRTEPYFPNRNSSPSTTFGAIWKRKLVFLTREHWLFLFSYNTIECVLSQCQEINNHTMSIRVYLFNAQIK